jgi:hypothetical protein
MIQLILVGIVAVGALLAGPDKQALQIQANVAAESRAQNEALKLENAKLTPAELDAKYPAATPKEVTANDLYWKGEKQ